MNNQIYKVLHCLIKDPNADFTLAQNEAGEYKLAIIKTAGTPGGLGITVTKEQLLDIANVLRSVAGE